MDDKRARHAIEAAREWQGNAELCIAAEIVEDLVDELEARLPPLLTEEESHFIIGAIPLQALPDDNDATPATQAVGEEWR